MQLVMVRKPRDMEPGDLSPAAFGFSQVICAESAAAAEAVVEDGDVVLFFEREADEAGLLLCRRLRELREDIAFLYASPRRSYSLARRALHAGCVALIARPDDPAAVQEGIRRGVQWALLRARERESIRLGQNLREHIRAVAENALRFKLMGGRNNRELGLFEALGYLPDMGRVGVTLRLRVLRWFDERDQWEPELLFVALKNITGELFEGTELSVTGVYVSDHVFCIFLQPPHDGAAVDMWFVARQLTFLISVLGLHFRLDAAVYVSEPAPLDQIDLIWPMLEQLDFRNFTALPGVYRLDEERLSPYDNTLFETRSWHLLLERGQGEELRRRAFALLDRLSASGEKPAVPLIDIYQDFVQAVYHSIGMDGGVMRRLFATAEEQALFRTATRSAGELKQLIEHVCSRVELVRRRPQQAQAVTHIAAFIREHIDEELRCGDLAQIVHMNADYLSRLFKKETGHGLKDYIIRQRLQTARRLLRETDMSVSRVATCVGYCDFSHFSRMYKKVMKRTPQEDRGRPELRNRPKNKVGKTPTEIG